MPLTNAQKQARYRAARPFVDNGEGQRLVSAYLPNSTAFDLDRLTRHHGTSQRDVLAKVIKAAVESLTAGMNDADLEHFFREVTFKPRKRKHEAPVTE